MKILVTGIAGFLGSHLADRFIADGHEVVGVDNLIGGELTNVPKGAVYFHADCGDIAKVSDAMEGVEAVYHCACTAYEGLSVFSPSVVVRNTSGITATVLSAACAKGVKRFVYCSSMARYGKGHPPFAETAEPKPVDPYGIAKVASERLTEALCDAHGVKWSIAVPHNIVGPRQKYDDPYRNVASIMANLMLQGRQPVIYGDGKQRRCFTFIQDAVNPLVEMLYRDVSRETINIGPDEQDVSVMDLAKELADIIGFRLDPVFLPGRPLEVKNAVCSSEKARRLLGYETTTTFRQGLESIVEWIRENGTRPFRYHLPVEIATEATPRTWTERLF